MRRPVRLGHWAVRSDRHLHGVLPALGPGDTTTSRPCFPAHLSSKHFLSSPYQLKGFTRDKNILPKAKKQPVFIWSL